MREKEERRDLLVHENIMICRNHGKHGIPNQHVLGKLGKDLVDVDNRGKPEPDLEQDTDDFFEITEKNHKHAKEEPECIREDLLDNVYQRNQQEQGGEEITG